MRFLIQAILFLFSLMGSSSFRGMAQQPQKINLTLLVNAPTGSSNIFVAGSFNAWKPAVSAGTKISDSVFIFKILIDAGRHEFKFTNGSWDGVEVNKNGTDISNRILLLSKDTNINCTVSSFQNQAAKFSTQGLHVEILTAAVLNPYDKQARTLRIYLPPGYSKSNQRYPVMYMHDAQNLFDASTAFSEEWGVDEIMDSLITSGMPASIVVGIDNSADRVNEYNPYDHDKYGKGLGKLYIKWLIDSIKPFIDSAYRTMPGKNNCVIAGSSLGGLISFWASVYYPDIFGKAGIFSPSFWIAPNLYEDAQPLYQGFSSRLFFYMGGKEGNDAVAEMERYCKIMAEKSAGLSYTLINDDGEHSEKYWRSAFVEFYKWIIAERPKINSD